MNDNITMNTEAFNAMLEEYRDEGYKEGVNKVISILNKTMFVEQGATIQGDDISLYILQHLAEEGNE
jgi:hypothetical protein